LNFVLGWSEDIEKNGEESGTRGIADRGC